MTYTPQGARRIDTGRGVCFSTMTPYAIAEEHSKSLPAFDHSLFMDTFARVRHVAPPLAGDLDVLWTLMGGRHASPVMEAATIEALASLRAEGVRL